MCTAYEIGKRGGTFPEWVNARATEYLLGIDQPRIIRPTHQAPVILPDGNLVEMTWGFRRPVPAVKTKQTWRTIVNSREDKLKGRTWGKAFEQRRCLIPAASFFEWVDTPAGKAPLRFDDPGREILWIAGIWEEDKERGCCYSMITTEPNELVSPVHDRMPAVLLHHQIEPFMSGVLQEFGASRAALSYSQAENFLKSKKPIKDPPQGELF